MKFFQKSKRNLLIFSIFFDLIFIILAIFCINYHSVRKIRYDEASGKYFCRYKNSERSFLLYFPENFEAKSTAQKKNCRLVLALHGAGGDAFSFRRETQFDSAACSNNYVVAYVCGTPFKNISGGLPQWHYFDDSQGKDDFKFLINLSRALQREYKLNKRKFALGFSNGGIMCTKLASNSKEFAGIASISGMMSENFWETRLKKPGTAFLQINGTKDELVPMKMYNFNENNQNPFMDDVIEYFSSAKNKAEWLLIPDEVHRWPQESFCNININTRILDFFDSLQYLFPNAPSLF